MRAQDQPVKASNHSGVCLALDRLLLENQIEAELEPLGAVHSGNVVYTARGFSETSSAYLVLESFRDDQLEEDVAAYVMNHVDDMFFTKTLDWESEDEFRFTLVGADCRDQSDEFIYVPLHASSVQAVIVGEQFPDWQITAAKWACEQLGLVLTRLQWEQGLPLPLPA